MESIPLKPVNLKVYPLLGSRLSLFSRGVIYIESVCAIVIVSVIYFGPLLLVQEKDRKILLEYFHLPAYVKR